MRLLSIFIGLTLLYESVSTYDDEELDGANDWLNNLYDGINNRFGDENPLPVCYMKNNQSGRCVKNELCSDPAPSLDPTTQFTLRERDTCSNSEICCLKVSRQKDSTTKDRSSSDKWPCTTDQQKEGVCVKKSLCSNAEKTVDPTTLFIPRNRESCHALEACCSESDVQTTAVKALNPNTDQGCGWSNPGANIFREKTSASGLADYGEFPWMIALIRKENENKGWNVSYAGGGTLIHPSVVITAAHKVSAYKPSELKIRAGEWDTRTEAEIDVYQEVDIAKFIIHESYDRAHARNNVALLILKSPVDLTDAPHIGLACLAPQLPPPGTQCFGMGWGEDFLNKESYAVILKKLELPLVEGSVCEKQYQGTKLTSAYRLDKSLTCAGGEKGVDTCLGDGGSPLVCPVAGQSERFAVVGMVAYGLGCGTENLPGVYVNVPNVYDWVGRQLTSEKLNKTSFQF